MQQSPLTCILVLAGAITVTAQTTPPPSTPPPSTPVPATSSASETAPVLPRRPAYKPPKVGAPAVRVAGGSRGGDFDGVVLQALVPDHAGRTLLAAPSLYWYQSKPAKAQFEITITARGDAKTILQRTGKGEQTAGIHRINLANEKDAAGKPIELKPGVAYKWTVALIPDAESRSKDIIASGIVERVPPGSELEQKLAKAPAPERVCLLAENGIWYDAFAAASQLASENPKASALRSARADLLANVGLKEAADAARK